MVSGIVVRPIETEFGFGYDVWVRETVLCPAVSLWVLKGKLFTRAKRVSLLV